jgi:hypothetical protein
MRLYDKIMSAPGTLIDAGYYGAYTTLARELKQAQCFILSPDLAEACEEVCWSRPSSILSAQHTLRAPYPRVWFEWNPNDRDKHARFNGKPRPKTMGCFLHSNPEGTKGAAIYVWEHKIEDELCKKLNIPELTMDPFGIIFDWSGSEEPVMAQYARTIGLPFNKEQLEKKYREQREAFRATLSKSDKWKNLARDEREVEAFMELEKSSGIIPLEMCKGLFESNLGKDIRPGKPMFEAFMEDLAGEFSYAQAFLLMLNSRNKIVSQTREDLSRLNKARGKNKKPPLKEFIVTDLRLSKTQQTRAEVLGIDRAISRRHLVRGHFKLKYGQVWWWSPHMRGGGPNSPVARKEYRVSL